MSRTPSRRLWLAYTGIALAGLTFILWRGRGNTFFYDEWGWIEFRRSGLTAILDSYNQHMEVLPLAVYQLLFHTIGIEHYRYYRLLAALGHLFCVTAVFAYALRRIGMLALAVAVPLAFLGAGWEFILWGVNFGFTTSIGCGVLALVCLDGQSSRASRAACLLLCLGLLFSESALLFALGAAVELTWRDRGLRRWWVWAAPAAAYAVWWLLFYTPYLSEHDLAAVPGFLAQLAAGASGGAFGLSVAHGWVVLGVGAAVVVARVVRRRDVGPRLVGLLIILATFWVLVAVSRAQLGDPGASRYVYTGTVLLVLITIEAFRGVGVTVLSVTVTILVCCGSLIGNLRVFGSGEASLAVGSRAEAAQIGALQLARRVAPSGLVLDPHWSPQIFADQYFAAVRDLRSTPADPPSLIRRRSEVVRAAADDVLVRAGELRVKATAGGAPLSPAPPRVEFASVGTYTVGHGCIRFASGGAGSTLDLLMPAAGIELRGLGGSGRPSAVRVRRFASGYENGPIAELEGRETILIRTISDSQPDAWHLRLSPWESVAACALDK